MVFMKKSTHFRHKRYHGCCAYFYKLNTIRDTSFCDAITNIYDEIVLKVFIRTTAKPHVKRITVNYILKFRKINCFNLMNNDHRRVC